jgi:hypothetical protein
MASDIHTFRTNKAWSILFRGVPGDTPAYSRHVDPAVFEASTVMLDAVSPPGFGDSLYRAVQADELIGVILRSSFRDQFLDWDINNTYEKASLVHPVAGAAYRETTAGTVDIYTAANDTELQDQGFAHKTWLLVIDTVAEDVSYDDVTLPYTISNGLTSHIILSPGLAIQMRFPTILSEHTVIYDYTTSIDMDWGGILARIENIMVDWKDPKFQKTWNEHWVWTERLAAFVFNALEASEHAR